MRFIKLSYLFVIALVFMFFQSCQEDAIPTPSLDVEVELRSSRDVFLMFHRGSTNQQIFVQKYDEEAQGQTVEFETAYQLPSNIRTKTVPEAMVHNGQVFLYWKAENTTDIWMSRADIEDAENGNGSGWSQPLKVLDTPGCERSPAIVRYNNLFFMFHEDVNRIKFHSSVDGISWGNTTTISTYEVGTSGFNTSNGLINVRHHKFAVAVLENRLYCFFVDQGDVVRYLSATPGLTSGSLDWQVPLENGTFLPSAGIQTNTGLEKTVINNNKLYLVFSTLVGKNLNTRSASVDRISDGKLTFGGSTSWNAVCGSTAGALRDQNRMIITYRDAQRSQANIESADRNISFSTIAGQTLNSDLTDGSSVDGTDLIEIR